MKKIIFLMILISSMALTTACTSDNPSNVKSKYDPADASGPIAESGDLLSFAIDIDKTSAEPADGSAPYYPKAEDDIGTQTFATQITIEGETGCEVNLNGTAITNPASTALALSLRHQLVLYRCTY
jgi:hypothetical protein